MQQMKMLKKKIFKEKEKMEGVVWGDRWSNVTARDFTFFYFSVTTVFCCGGPGATVGPIVVLVEKANHRPPDGALVVSIEDRWSLRSMLGCENHNSRGDARQFAVSFGLRTSDQSLSSIIVIVSYRRFVGFSSFLC
jgi:hypothetical protein